MRQDRRCRCCAAPRRPLNYSTHVWPTYAAIALAVIASIWVLVVACVSPVALPLFEVVPTATDAAYRTTLVGGSGVCVHADASRPKAWTCLARSYGGLVDGSVPEHARSVGDALENTRNALRIMPYAIAAAYIIWPSLTAIMWLLRRRKRLVAGRPPRKRTCSTLASNLCVTACVHA